MKKKPNLLVLMDYAGNFKYFTIGSIILAAVSACLALMPFVEIWKIVNEVLTVSPDFSKAQNIESYGYSAVTYAVNAMCIYFGALACSHVGAFRTVSNIREKCVAKVLRMPLGHIENEGSGKIRKIIVSSSAAVENFLAHITPDRTVGMVTPLAMIVMLLYFDWKIGLLCIGTVVIGFAIMYMFMVGKNLKKDIVAYNAALENMTNEAVEYVRGMPVVKTFGQSVYSFKRFKKSIDDYEKFTVSYTNRFRIPMTSYTVVINAAFAILIAVALYHGNDSASPEFFSNLMFYIIFTPVIAVTLYKLMHSSEADMIVGNSLERIDSILNVKENVETANPQEPKDYSVEFQNIKFSYEGATKNALDGISLQIPSGGHVAFVGPSGGGKTTSASLVSRFWDPDEGKILIGGIDVKDISTEKLSEIVSYVFQDSKLLKTSIMENVRMAKPDATDQEVIDVLRRAQCSDIIDRLPEGANSILGSKGTYLSGGEQQRIAIARVMLRNTPVLVLDEATAFADPENEEKVQQAFNEISKGKTVIKIAHRLSTIVDSDEIFVLKDGKIAENGKHQQLVDQNGIYSKMWTEYQKSIEWKIDN
ncbi:MAG: ABC transporter ATP-binding protein/permease [Bacteroidales bacterium]|nr:ABC transporter ATP-binding protein/permease [Bacteroidales bacterium]